MQTITDPSQIKRINKCPRVIMEQDSEIDLSRFVLNMLLSIDSERIDFHSEMKGSLIVNTNT